MTRFTEVPNTPNCVSTDVAPDDPHHILPVRYLKPWTDAKQTLMIALTHLPRVKLVLDDGPYLSYEFKSLIFRFVDDVEFLFDEESKTVRFRSASRVGRSDFGANRKRMEKVRALISGKI